MKSTISKADILERIVVELKTRLSGLMRASNATREEAVHEDIVAEDKYYTRGLEASYLAAGQTRQIEELAAAIREYGSMRPVVFRAKDPADLGALVEVQSESVKRFYFIGPCAGGAEIHVGEKPILVLTPQSPLGSLLMGRKKGERMKFRRGDEDQIVTITAIR